MGVITWRNVEAPSFGEASRMMAQAQIGLNSGFDHFNNILNKAQATSEANWQQGKENNTEAAYAQLAKYDTPEKYQAALDSGEIDALTAGMGAQVDRAGFRKAMTDHLGNLRERALKGMEYTNKVDANTMAPILERRAQAVLTGNADEVARIDAEYAGRTGLAKGMEYGLSAQELAAERSRKAAEELRKVAEEGRKVELFPLDKQAKQQSIEASQAQVRASNAQADAALAEPAVKAAKLQRETEEKALKDFHENSAYGSKQGFSTDPTVNSSNIAKVISDKLGKVNPESAQKLSKVFADNPAMTLKDSTGKDVSLPIPPAVVSRAMEMVDSGASSGIAGFFADKGYGSDYLAAVQTKVRDLMMEGAKDPNADSLLNQYGTLSQLNANRLRLPGSSSGNGPASTTQAPKEEAPAAPSSVVAALDKAAAKANAPAATPAEESSGVDPQKLLAELSAKNPKAKSLWVNGERYKYQSVTDADNNVTGNAWVRDTGVGGLLSSGVSNARARNGYTGEDSGTDVKSSAATAETLKAALKNSAGVTNAPAEQPKVSAPVATNIGKAPVPVKASETVAFAPDGTSTPAPPINPSKAEIKALGSPETVVAAYKGAIPKGQGTKVLVTMVGDGDTFNFNPTDPNQKVPGSVGNVCRFDLIDAPETAHPSVGKKGQPYGPEAATYLRQMIENREVNIRVTGQAKRSDTDKARNLCQVEIEGKGVDLEMVKAGFAMVYTDFIQGNERGDTLKAAENKARTNGLGQFNGGGYAQPPRDFRRIQNRLNK